MMRFSLYFALACVAFTFTEGTQIKEIIVIKVNVSEPKVFEESITFDTDAGKTSPKTGSNSGIVEIKYIGRKRHKPKTTTRTVLVTDVKLRPKIHHHRHLKKRCCQAGELAGKHGLSCLIPRNFKHMFFNLVTHHRMKYQGTINENARRRFRSKIIKGIYKEIKTCVKRQKKSVVQKCCLGYKSKQRRRFQG